MQILLVAIFAGSVGFAIWQGYLIRQLTNLYSRPAAEWPADRPLPSAAIILSLRGHDPFLQQCIRNLILQDYPDFKIHIVIDSDSDPAWDAVNAALAEFAGDRLRIGTLSERSSFCSLKNSSIIQAIRNLSDDVEVVALVDADAIVSPTWLRSLVAPLADPEVGCTTGVRWFAPVEHSLGSRVRSYWNQIAAPMIYASHIPWGGSMVVRRGILDTGLADDWSRMFCEDAHTINHLRKRGIKLAYVSEATIVNEEQTSLSGCCRFVNRQMLIFRLYNGKWPSLLMTILAAAVLRITHDVMIAATLLSQDFTSAALLICMHPIILITTNREAARLDRAVRKKLRKSGREIQKTPLPGVSGYFCVEILFLTSMLTAIGTRTANWRGIQYRIRGPRDITMLAYSPYETTANTAAKSPTTVV